MTRTRTLAPLALIAVGVVLLILVIDPFGGGAGHYVRAQFTSVEQLVPGLEVRIAGRKVGSIDAIDLVNGHPVAKLGISESDVWPLPAGTTAAIHWGSTTSLAYRYLELYPGPQSGRTLAEGALIPTHRTVTPVELDQYYRIFRGRTNGDLGALVSELSGTLAPNGPALRNGLAAAPGGLNATSAVLNQLGSDQRALQTLVAQGNQVTSALASRQSDLGALMDNLAGTFDEFARHTSDEQASLQQAPQALSTATATLGRLDTSLNGLQTLVNDVAPGAIQLRALAPTARQALLELEQEAPLAISTLNRGASAAPALDSLERTGTPFMPRAGSTLGQLSPMFACMRPYTPELAGMLGTWTGWNDNYDPGGHYARTFPLALNPAILPGTPLTPGQVVSGFKQSLFYAMPRPPGLNAGHPVFDPQCGIGPQSLVASADPEVGQK